jgi:ERCC4-type nuclease
VSFQLPALKSLGELSAREPVIVIDTHEIQPLSFQRLQTVRGTLTTGDYSNSGLEDLFAVERKTVADLVGCCLYAFEMRYDLSIRVRPLTASY